MKIIMDAPWPGNVRQLENVIERAITLMGDREQILPEDLPRTSPGGPRRSSSRT